MKNILLIIFLFINFYSVSQETGIYGKTNLFSLNALGSFPLLQNVAIFASRNIQPKVKSKNGVFKDGYYLFNGGLNLGFVHARSKSSGFGFEIETYFNSVSAPNIGWIKDDSSYNYYDIGLKHESLDVGSFTFLVKNEFRWNGEDKSLPFGITNQVGIGYTVSKVLDRDYQAIVTYIDPQANLTPEQINTESGSIFNVEDLYWGITLMYGINVRNPISKRLTFNYGIRYTVNIYKGFNGTTGYHESGDYDGYLVDKYSMRRYIGLSKFTNFAALNIGFSYAF